jgi:hypothetical protein
MYSPIKLPNFQVLGDRLPTWADRENLPYVEATIAEMHRKTPIGKTRTVAEYTVECD